MSEAPAPPAAPDTSGGGNGENFFTRNIGPLPAWIWLIVIAGGLAVSFYLRRRGMAASPPPSPDGELEPNMPGTEGPIRLPDGVGEQPTEPPAPGIMTNQQWLTEAQRYLRSLEEPILTSQRALNKYIGGETLSENEQRLVTLAIEGVGFPPEPVPRPPDEQPEPPPERGTNEDWYRLAHEALTTGGASSFAAQVALRGYLGGETLTVAQAELVEQAIGAIGLPPEPVPAPRTQDPAPAPSPPQPSDPEPERPSCIPPPAGVYYILPDGEHVLRLDHGPRWILVNGPHQRSEVQRVYGAPQRYGVPIDRDRLNTNIPGHFGMGGIRQFCSVDQQP